MLEKVRQPAAGRAYLVRFTCPEFTSLCPVTGQPDFAHLVIDYVPRAFLVESKSLKLYLGAFRNHGAFHEDCTVAIARRLSAEIDAASGCASAATGIRAAACRSTCSTRPARRPRGCGCPTKASRPIAGAARSVTADPRQAIRDHALALGFDAVGFAKPDLAPRARADLAEYLRRGYHGDMGWLAETRRTRGDPAALWPEVRKVVVLGVNYGPESDPLEATRRRGPGAISVYAQGRDYHDVVKKRLKALARWIHARWPGELKVFVDTAPVMEKPLAEQAGLGWQGKHTNLVSRDFGSWLFLGEIYLSLDLAARRGRGGSLRRLPALPRCLPDRGLPGALPARCAALHLLPHDRAKGHIDAELRPLMGNRIYGCDDCLAVCPWNKFARAHERAGVPAARRRSWRRAWRRWPRSTTRRFARCSRARRSSASGATGSSATC